MDREAQPVQDVLENASAPSRGRAAMRFEVVVEPAGSERRQHRRHDFETRLICIDRWDGARREGQPIGRIVDLSAGGLRLRTNDKSIRPDAQIRVRISLPAYAGISPFLAAADGAAKPKNEWVGWVAVTRVIPASRNELEVAGRLVDMDEAERGMLGLYLSTQPIAA